MRGSGPTAGAPVKGAERPPRGLPRCVQFSVARSVQFSMAIDTEAVKRPDSWRWSVRSGSATGEPGRMGPRIIVGKVHYRETASRALVSSRHPRALRACASS